MKKTLRRYVNPKKQTVEGLIKTMLGQWKMQERVVANDLGQGKFLLNFETEDDLNSVIRQGQFHYNFCMFVLVRWEPVIDDDYPWVIPFWVEIIGIPLHLWTIKNLENIERRLGHIDTVELSVGRMLIEVDTRKPLTFTRKVSWKGKEVSIFIRYEKLFKHCPPCGMLTQEAAYCPLKAKSEKSDVFDRVQLPDSESSRQPSLRDQKSQERYGSYNRVDHYGQEEEGRRDTYYHSRNGAATGLLRDVQAGYLRSNNIREDPMRRNGGKISRYHSGFNRNTTRYEPYQKQKSHVWKRKEKTEVRPDRRDDGDAAMVSEKSSVLLEGSKEVIPTMTIQERGSGRRLASKIISPLPQDVNVTKRVRLQNITRTLSFSPKEKIPEQVEDEQVIGALNDMKLADINMMEEEEHGEPMLAEDPNDDLLGEDLMEMEEEAKKVRTQGRVRTLRREGIL
ncbi:Uncharacterized protein Rs2_47753 [Raphanus sativus]|uniref:Uncharacterized protein LOC108807788 n=1 Tax=Raphanus sativus TaxID=3726 RepID=A0A9W3CR55_RAPSA|nr:uncharacterized protein LOC108807788 [Raphanus sativus]KAJ4870640.1 Uncharacterized protein Rs2_47753 [Raphanus sativus]